MTRSFFLKYYCQRNGVRFVINDRNYSFTVLHDQKKHPEDEVFKYFEGFEKLVVRLRELCPTMTTEGVVHGDVLFIYLFQDVFNRLARYRARAKKKRRPSRKT